MYNYISGNCIRTIWKVARLFKKKTIEMFYKANNILEDVYKNVIGGIDSRYAKWNVSYVCLVKIIFNKIYSMNLIYIFFTIAIFLACTIWNFIRFETMKIIILIIKLKITRKFNQENNKNAINEHSEMKFKGRDCEISWNRLKI